MNHLFVKFWHVFISGLIVALRYLVLLRWWAARVRSSFTSLDTSMTRRTKLMTNPGVIETPDFPSLWESHDFSESILCHDACFYTASRHGQFFHEHSYHHSAKWKYTQLNSLFLRMPLAQKINPLCFMAMEIWWQQVCMEKSAC